MAIFENLLIGRLSLVVLGKVPGLWRNREGGLQVLAQVLILCFVGVWDTLKESRTSGKNGVPSNQTKCKDGTSECYGG